MSRSKYTKEDLEKAVKENYSIAGVCRALHITPVGGNYRTIHLKIKEYNLDTSHFTGQGWNVGLRYKPIMNPKTYKLEDILIKDSPYRSLSKLKIRLISEGIKENICECCNNTMWLGKPIKLELHHINGINTDNRLENLQLLCPNCHAYTDNYRGRNQESALSKKREVEYRKVKEALTDNADGNLEPSLIKEGAETIHDKSKSSRKRTRICPCCKQEFIPSYNKQKYCSQECSHKDKGRKRPPVIELLEKFKELHSYLQVSKFYGVTDNAIRKWVKLYQIEDMIKK